MSEYTHRAKVFFREAEHPGWYYCKFEPEDSYLEKIATQIESQFGGTYQRMLAPGDEIYVGYIKYNPDEAVWTFNQLPPENIGIEADGWSHGEETCGLDTGEHQLTAVYDAVELVETTVGVAGKTELNLVDKPGRGDLGSFEGELLEYNCSCGETLSGSYDAVKEHLQEEGVIS